MEGSEILKDEVRVEMKKMNKNKIAGSDGIVREMLSDVMHLRNIA